MLTSAPFVTAAISGLLVTPLLFSPMSPYDSGIAASAATFTLHGQLPYRDYWLLYGPLSGWLVAIPTAIFGPSVLLLRIVGLAITSGTAFLGAAIANHWRVNRIALPVVVGASTLEPIFVGLEPSAWSVGMFLALLGLLFRFQRGIDPAICGLVLGLAFLSRLDLGAYALLAGMVMPGGRARVAVAFGLVVSIFGVVVLSTTPLNSAFEQLIWYPLIGPRQYRGMPGPYLQVGQPTAVLFSIPTEYFPRASILAAASVLIWRGNNTKTDRSVAAMLLFAVLCQLQTTGRSDFFHYSQAAFPALVLACSYFGSRRRPNVVEIGRLALLATPAILMCWLAGRSAISADHSYDIALEHAIKTIDRSLELDEPIFAGLTDSRFALWNPLLIYYLADRPAATRYTMFNPGITNTPAAQREMVQHINGSKTQIVVLDRTYAGVFEEFNDSRIPGSSILDDYISANFIVECDFGVLVVDVRRGFTGAAGRCRE